MEDINNLLPLTLVVYVNVCGILTITRSSVTNSTFYLLTGLLVSLWVGLLTTDVTDACDDTVDMLILLPVRLGLFILLLLSLLVLADEDLE